jgi:hypothetical protein
MVARKSACTLKVKSLSLARLTGTDASTSAIQEYVNGNPWVKGSTLPVALTGSSIAAISWQQPGSPSPHLRVYYQDPAHNLKEHAWDGGWYVGKKSC